MVEHGAYMAQIKNVEVEGIERGAGSLKGSCTIHSFTVSDDLTTVTHCSAPAQWLLQAYRGLLFAERHGMDACGLSPLVWKTTLPEPAPDRYSAIRAALMSEGRPELTYVPLLTRDGLRAAFAAAIDRAGFANQRAAIDDANLEPHAEAECWYELSDGRFAKASIEPDGLDGHVVVEAWPAGGPTAHAAMVAIGSGREMPPESLLDVSGLEIAQVSPAYDAAGEWFAAKAAAIRAVAPDRAAALVAGRDAALVAGFEVSRCLGSAEAAKAAIIDSLREPPGLER